jgi:hypothetical protein
MEKLTQKYDLSTEVRAAGVNRILQWWSMYDCGTISACRTYDSSLFKEYGLEEVSRLPESVKKEFLVSNKVNMYNSRTLRMKIKRMGYAYIQIDGVYKEAGTGRVRKELSYFVFDNKRRGTLKRDLIALGFFFHQDTITYADAGQDFSIYVSTPFYEDQGGMREHPTGKKEAFFTGKSIKRLNDANKWKEYQDAYELALERKKHDPSVELPPKPESQFFSEEDIYSMIRGKGFAWSNYTPVQVESSAPDQLDARNYTPTELLSFFARTDTRPLCTEDNYDVLMER